MKLARVSTFEGVRAVLSTLLSRRAWFCLMHIAKCNLVNITLKAGLGAKAVAATRSSWSLTGQLTDEQVRNAFEPVLGLEACDNGRQHLSHPHLISDDTPQPDPALTRGVDHRGQ
jgi:hypothetical protein